MALEQAGVELIAKNYREYVSQLRKVDKAQQTVFKQRSSQTVQAHQQAGKAAQNHGRKVKGLGDQYKQLNKIILAVVGARIVREGFEAMEEALDFRRVQQQLANFAATSGQSANEIIQAMDRAADGTISNADLVTRALSIMRLEVAATPAEIEEFVTLGVALRQTGVDAADAIDQLTVALGRKSLRVLDNFNISQTRARREMEKLAQTRFGVPLDELDEATKDLIFMDAALAAMRSDFEAMGGAAVESGNSVSRLRAEFENTKLVIGTVVATSGGIAEKLAEALETLQKVIAFAHAGAVAYATMFGAINKGLQGLKAEIAELDPGRIGLQIGQNIAEGLEEGEGVGQIFNRIKEDLPKLREGAEAIPEALSEGWEEAQDKSLEAFEETLRAMGILGEGVAATTDEFEEQGNQIKDNTDLVKDQVAALKSQQQAAERAAKIQLSFTRAQDDAIRRAGRAADKLQKQQADELLDLRKDLDEQLADLDKDRAEQSEKLAEETAKTIKRSQDSLNRQLRQAQERFNLTRLQGERRFQVQDRRLRAEGNILALMDLREDHRLSERENKENFDLQQKQQKENSGAQLREQVEDIRARAKELQKDLEERRQEIFASYDKELEELRASHEEQREEQSAALAEQLEDLRRNRARQLEDLGRNLGDQQQMTKEGAEKIAGEIERVFGDQGIADQVMSGYEARTTGRWARIFGDLERRIASTEARLKSVPKLPTSGGGFSLPPPAGIGMRQGMMDIVQGPQTLFVEPGVRELVMASPVPAVGGRSALDVNMSGGFNISGAEAAGKAATEAALDRMVIEFETAVRRMGRSM